MDEHEHEESEGYKAEVQTSSGKKKQQKKQKSRWEDDYDDDFEEEIAEDIPEPIAEIEDPGNLGVGGSGEGGITVS